MPYTPVNPSQRSRHRANAGQWEKAPGPVAEVPVPPSTLGAPGLDWWAAAWRSDLSSVWSEIERMQVARAAHLADKVAAKRVNGAVATELRALETELGLSFAGRSRRRVLPADPAAAGAVDYSAQDAAMLADMAERRKRTLKLVAEIDARDEAAG